MAESEQKEAQIQWMAFQSGKRKAFEWLYKAYVKELYHYGFKFSNNTALIEDCIQDLFIRIWYSKKQLKVPPSVKNYLFTAFRHLMFRKLEKLRKVSSRDISEEQYSGLWELSLEEAFIEEENASLHANRLQQAINQLTLRQKEALFLRFYENASYEEVARAMGISVKATYKIVARAIDKLRNNWIALPYIISTLILLNLIF